MRLSTKMIRPFQFALLLTMLSVAIAARAQDAAIPPSTTDAPTIAAPTPDAPTGPVRVSGGIMASLLQSKTAPVYPQAAISAGISGVVVLHAVIGSSGLVENLQVVSGNAILGAAALDAVKTWIYQPYLLNGAPQRVETVVMVRFSPASTQVSPPTTPVQDPNAPTDPPGVVVDAPSAPLPPPFCGSTTPGDSDYHLPVSSDVTDDLLLFMVYPQPSTSGTAVMNICISQAGSVEKVQPVSGPTALQSALTDALMQWTYQSYLVDGQPVALSATLTYTLP